MGVGDAAKWVFMLGEKLSVGDIFASAVGHALSNFGQAIKVSIPWLVTTFAVVSLLIGATGITATADGGITVRDPGLGTAILVLVSLFVIVVVASACAVSWHRFVIDNEPPPLLPLLDRRAFVYAGMMIALGFAGGLMILVLGAILGTVIEPLQSTAAIAIAAVALYLLVALTLGRLVLVLPATAMDDTTLTFAESWRWSTGNSWRILGCLLLTSLVTAVPEWLMNHLVDALPFLAIPSLIVSFLLSALSFTIWVGALSQIYLALTRDFTDGTEMRPPL